MDLDLIGEKVVVGDVAAIESLVQEAVTCGVPAWEGAGFRVHDLGADVAPERFVQAVLEDSADIVGLSALMTTTMPSMKRTIEALEAADLRRRVKVLVGGAPATQEYCDEIGADGCAPDASSGVRKAKALVGVI